MGDVINRACRLMHEASRTYWEVEDEKAKEKLEVKKAKTTGVAMRNDLFNEG